MLNCRIRTYRTDLSRQEIKLQFGQQNFCDVWHCVRPPGFFRKCFCAGIIIYCQCREWRVLFLLIRWDVRAGSILTFRLCVICNPVEQRCLGFMKLTNFCLVCVTLSLSNRKSIFAQSQDYIAIFIGFYPAEPAHGASYISLRFRPIWSALLLCSR